MKPLPIALGIAAALTLAGCTTPPGPVEVTRFIAPDRLAQLGQGSIFVETAGGVREDSLALAPYKAAVAEELRRLGYSESDRSGAGQVAEVAVERYVIGSGGDRSPVSVGVGGSTGSYGSGVGVGIGINLGGGQKDRIGTELAVTIRDKASGESIWEGRADFQAPENSPLARAEANAQTVASALFREFPGNNGETIEVEVNE
ncbi:MAG: hypothetical protein AB3N06_07100 [Erythrobacter sp.]